MLRRPIARILIMAYLSYSLSIPVTRSNDLQLDDNCQCIPMDSLMNDEFIQLMVTGVGNDQISLGIECDSLRVAQAAD